MFKVGQIVYCTNGAWKNDFNISLFNPPKLGQQCVISAISVRKGVTYLHFRGQPIRVGYPAKHFRPQYCLFADNVIANLTKQRV